MDRRNFLKASCALCGLGVTGTALFLESCNNGNAATPAPQGPTVNFTIDISKPANAALNNTGGSVALKGVVVVNAGNGSYYGIAQSCTHNGCNINYDKIGNDFVCPCHGASFDTNGNITGGPAPAPLKKYSVTKNGSVLTIVG